LVNLEREEVIKGKLINEIKIYFNFQLNINSLVSLKSTKPLIQQHTANNQMKPHPQPPHNIQSLSQLEFFKREIYSHN